VHQKVWPHAPLFLHTTADILVGRSSGYDWGCSCQRFSCTRHICKQAMRMTTERNR